MSDTIQSEPDKRDWRAKGINLPGPGPGRDPLYTPAIGNEICNLIAEGKTIQQIADIDGMPSYRTIMRWRAEMPVFGIEYARARKESAEYLENEAIQRLRDATDKDDSLSARNLLEGIKWSTAKRDPETYGERVTTDVRFTGSLAIDDGNADRAALMLELMRKLGVDAPPPPMIEGSIDTSEDTPDDDTGSV